VQRHLQLRRGGRVVAQVPMAVRGGVTRWTLALPSGVKPEDWQRDRWRVVLTGRDAVAANDGSPVMVAHARTRLGVVSDRARSAAATGGAPPVEKALRALRMGVQRQPLARVPDRREDFDGLRALIVDDVPGLTAAQRRALGAWIERGGVLLLTLGPESAAAPLGAGFSPVIDGVLRWRTQAPDGIDPDTDRLFGAAAPGLAALAAKGRAELALEDPTHYEVMSRWADGEPFAWRKRHGRGVVFLLGLPLSLDISDFVLRPAFLALLQHVVEQARTRGGAGHTVVGTPWIFAGYRDVQVYHQPVASEERQMELTSASPRTSYSPPLAGRYRVVLDGEDSLRNATFDASEVDMRPRRFTVSAPASELGSDDTRIDVSAYIALGLLLLVAIELGLRLRGARLFWRRQTRPLQGD
jgi:hypothetical protein